MDVAVSERQVKWIIRQGGFLIVYSVMALQYSTVYHCNAITGCVLYTYYNVNGTNRVPNEISLNKIKITYSGTVYGTQQCVTNEIKNLNNFQILITVLELLSVGDLTS